MKLEKITYSEFNNLPQEWRLDNCDFGDINLIVGKNATGKTRTLNIINGLSGLLTGSGPLTWKEGFYQAELINDQNILAYTLDYSDGQIVNEELKINGILRLSRKKNGIGTIYAEQLGRNIDFQIDSNIISAQVKRDSIQHPFLNELYYWANGVTRYDFNSGLGKDMMVIIENKKKNPKNESKINIKETQKAIQIFLQGKKEFSDTYINLILEDMKAMDYEISKIGVTSIKGLIQEDQINDISCLYVQELDLKTKTSQIEMSNGMFRALSVLIQVNYALLSHQATCILIDDIGEGLDYTRSSGLVKILIGKAKGSSIQLIMTTNDRFIMNAVPLEYWIILDRKSGEVKNINYRNSKEIFQRFEKTGLNNFDFFSSNYFSR